jgi:hypothetical protein
MQGNSPSTPNPMSPGSIIAQLIWFGGNANTTLCGLPATRYVDVFKPDEVSCRECKKRWRASHQYKMDVLNEMEGHMNHLEEAVNDMIADRKHKIERIEAGLQEVHDMNNAIEAEINDRAAGKQVEVDPIILRWVEENIPEEDRIAEWVTDPETGKSRWVHGIRETGQKRKPRAPVETAEEDSEADTIVQRWIDEDIPEEDRTVDVVFDSETGKSRIIYGIRETGQE